MQRTISLLVLVPLFVAPRLHAVDAHEAMDAHEAVAEQAAVDERAMISEHLASVEFALRNRELPELTAEEREARARNLDVLAAYRERGEFPANTDFSERTPYFIDERGVPCAMAHLMIESGWEAEAESIAANENNAFVRDIRSPHLARWLEDSGMLAEEAQWVQPTYWSDYDHCSCEVRPVCGEWGTTYMNACTAERNTPEYIPGCCEPISNETWTRPSHCSGAPSRVAATCGRLVDGALAPIPVDGGCASAPARGPLGVPGLLGLLGLLGLVAAARSRTKDGAVGRP